MSVNYIYESWQYGLGENRLQINWVTALLTREFLMRGGVNNWEQTYEAIEINHRAHKAWKAHHFVMRVSKKEIGIQKLSLPVIGTSYS